MSSVEIYTREFCQYCQWAKELLSRKGVNFREFNVTEHREKREEMIQRSNGGTTFPQIFIGKTHIGGCDELYALEDAGKLDALLGADESSTA
jgi:glutaredoxin 3